MPSRHLSGFPVINAGTVARGNVNQAVTVPAGLSNTCLVVRVSHEAASAGITGATFNGIALTKARDRAATTWSRAELWYLINPPAGNFTLAVLSGGTTRYGFVVDLLVDVDQASPLRGSADNAHDGGTAINCTVAGVQATDLVLDTLSVDSTGHAPAPGPDQAADFATQNLGGGSNEFRGSSQPGSAGGVMSWTWAGSNPASIVAVAFRHAAASDTVPPGNVQSSAVAQRISRVAGRDASDITFTADEAFVEYMLRRVNNASDINTQGTLIEQAAVASRTSHTVTLTDDELVAAGGAEGPNLVKAFVRDAAGNWST